MKTWLGQPAKHMSEMESHYFIVQILKDFTFWQPVGGMTGFQAMGSGSESLWATCKVKNFGYR